MSGSGAVTTWNGATWPPSAWATHVARRTISGTESGQETGARTMSPTRRAAPASDTTFGADLEATTDATITVTRITMSTALTTRSSNRPTSNPTIVAASVAAACAFDRPNITPICGLVKPRIRPVASAAIAFDTIATAANAAARPRVERSNTTRRSTSIPTDTRKIGIRREDPTNSTRCIKIPPFGTSRFNDKSRKKRSDDSFDPDHVCDDCRQEEGDEDEDESQSAILPHPPEEPTRHPRKQHDGPHHEHDNAGNQTAEELEPTSRIGHSDHDGEHHKRKRVRDRSASHGDRHRAVGDDPAAPNDRIHDERVRCPQRADQRGSRHREAERQCREHPDDHRNGECQEPEDRRWPTVSSDAGEVELETGQEHQVQQAEPTELLDSARSGEQAETLGSDEHARQDEADHARKSDPLGRERPDQNDRGERQKHPCWCNERHLDRHLGSVRIPRRRPAPVLVKVDRDIADQS